MNCSFDSSTFPSGEDACIKEESTEQESDYSDDFEEPDNENYSDEFETEPAELNDSLKTPVSPGNVTDGDKSVLNPSAEAQATAEDEYPDDFEMDSDAEDVLDEILTNARAAQETEVVNDVIQDQASPGLLRRHKLKQHMIGAFGEKVFEQVQRVNDGKSSESQVKRVEFEKLTGSEMMETCYLVNELSIDDS